MLPAVEWGVHDRAPRRLPRHATRRTAARPTRAAADVTLDAVFPSAGTRFIFPELLDEGLEPHEVGTVFIHGSDRPDVFIDIADTLPIKLAALREHRSQLGEWDPTDMITAWARQQGAPCGVAAAEAFRRMVLDGP